jgi:hypothetical protein
MDIEEICLGCASSNVKLVALHPYFKGSLCEDCAVRDILVILHGSILTSFYDIFIKV